MPFLILTLLAVASRLVPHPANFAPIGALALFLGAKAWQSSQPLNRALSLAIPILALLISDYIIGFYSWPVMLTVYASFALTLAIGFFIRHKINVTMVISASLLSSVLFYLTTNWAVWAFTPMYAKTFSGLIQSYLMAIPFFSNSLMGDLFYSLTLFGIYEFATNPKPFKKLIAVTN